MLDAEVFLVSQIDEPVITSPTIGMNDAFKVYTSTYDALESGSGAIRNDLRIDVIIAFESVFGNFSFYSYKKACGQKKTVRGSKNSRRLSNGTPAI